MKGVQDTPGRTRESVVLMLAEGARISHDLDLLRLMEGCFIVSQRGRRRWRTAFNFMSDRGRPFDHAVHRARDALVARGLLVAEQRGDHQALLLSEQGWVETERVREEIGDEDADWLARVGAYVTSRPYRQLVDEIHGPRPEFVVRSLVAR